MNVVIRADASFSIGNGHIMRCLTLADELAERGLTVKFICRDHAGNLSRYIDSCGYSVALLPMPSNYTRDNLEPGYVTWLGEDWCVDADQTMAAMDRQVDWLIVDHYAIDEKWHSKLKERVRNILVIDDLADRGFNCDVILDQTFGRTRKDYQVIGKIPSVYLLGSSYALLRREFIDLRPQALKKREGRVRGNKIMLSMGGVDKHDVTSQILNQLSRINNKKCLEVSVVLGPNAPHIDSVRDLVASLAFSCNLICDTRHMGEVILNSELAIGAAGTSTWERCCLGMPTLMFTTASNQVQIAENLQQSGAVHVLGDLGTIENNPDVLVDALNFHIGNSSLLDEMSKAAFSVVDGLGVTRVVNRMEAL